MTRKKKEPTKTKKKSAKGKSEADAPFIALEDERQRKAVTVLAYNGYRKGSGRRSGATVRAAQVAGVSERTLHKWLKDPKFVDAIEALKGEIVAEAMDTIREEAKSRNLIAA